MTPVPPPTGGDAEGLITNNLNGGAITDDVDTGDAGTLNALSIDPREWHDYWVTIEAGGAGTHQVRIWVDGDVSAPAAEFDVTAGNGSDFGGITYVAIGVGSTGQAGAIDIDNLCARFAAIEPQAPVEAQVPYASWPALLVITAALLAVGAMLARRQELAATS